MFSIFQQSNVEYVPKLYCMTLNAGGSIIQKVDFVVIDNDTY